MLTGRKTFLPMMVALALSAFPALAQIATVVEERPGGDLRDNTDIRIIKDAYTGVEGKRGASQLRWKANKVVEINWKVAPEAYKVGLNHYRDGSFVKAAQELLGALEKPGSYKWLPVYANYYIGRSLSRTGHLGQAIEHLNKVIEADKNHRFVPETYVLLADIHLRPGAPGGAKAARAALMKLKPIASALGRDSSYGIKVDLGLARLEVEAGDASKGLTMLTTLERKTREEGLLNLIAMVKGKAYVKMKDFSKAETAFNRILKSKKVKNAEVIAGAANGLGDAQYEQQKYKDAMWTYSRTYSLFLDREDLVREVGWALYRGGEAFQLHAGKVSGDDRKKFQRYGSRVLRKAATDFRTTRGGKLARQKLGLSN